MPERPGLIGEAHGSTLFLDEFAELPHTLQTHLLRVLDAGEYTRLGESRARSSDFRLIAATNRPEHALKEDVLARLRLRVEVCGIDQRREDIPLIARHILRRLARDDAYIAQRYFPDADPSGHPLISRALIEYLVRHTYSTHVRELEAMLWRAMSHAQGDILDLWPVEPPPGGVAALASSALAVDAAVFRPVVDAGMDTAAIQPAVDDAGTRSVVDPMSLAPEVIQECLDRHEGRQEPVWRELGLSSRHVLTRLVRRYGLIVRGRDR
jgi:two-component system nitrogen regulation response regulator GlnG/two-component system response regulator HydG